MIVTRMPVPPVYRRWVTCPEPRPHASLRLFCFHFAGGDASTFRAWTTQMPESIEVCPIEFPGRATRNNEAPITQFRELLEKVGTMVRPFLKDSPFAFFGHSFGGITAFELTRWLRRNAAPMPARLFLSACPALHLRSRPPEPITHLSDTEFLEQLAVRYGTPREVMNSEDVRQTVLPALRADLLVGESYRYDPEPPLEVPISSFGAFDDPEVSQEEAESWREQTTADFRLRMLPGNHFFLTTERRQLYKAIVEDLQVVL